MRGRPKQPAKAAGTRSAAEVLSNHVLLEVEGIDRLYLNVYVPRLQIVEGVLGFIRHHRGHKVPSTAMGEPITRAFVSAIERFASEHGIPVVNFEKGQRKDDVAAHFRATFKAGEGVVFIGKAQEKCRVYRTERRHNPRSGSSYAWIVKSTAMVNHYYSYCVDRDFGPFFVKFCSYFPYNGRLCLNGHEYAKRQLQKEGIPFEALDNGILSCDNPRRLQAICDGLSAARVDAPPVCACHFSLPERTITFCAPASAPSCSPSLTPGHRCDGASISSSSGSMTGLLQSPPENLTHLRQVLNFKTSSVVRHADQRLSRAARARLTFSRMSDALAVHTNSLGSLL